MLCFASVAEVAWGCRGEWGGIDQILSFSYGREKVVWHLQSHLSPEQWAVRQVSTLHVLYLFFFFPQPIHIHFYWPEVKGKTLFTSRDENQFLLFIHLLFVPLPIHSFLKCTLSISNPLSVGFQMKTCTATCTAPYQPVSNKTLSISVKIFWN